MKNTNSTCRLAKADCNLDSLQNEHKHIAYEALKLSNQLCFPIYALSKKITNHYRPLLNALDLTYPQYLVMLVLWEDHDTKTEHTVGSLCQKLHSDTGTITPLLKRLESKDYITRIRKSDDERVVVIQLTTAGIALAEQAQSIPTTMFNHMNAELAISPEELQLLQLIATKFCTS